MPPFQSTRERLLSQLKEQEQVSIRIEEAIEAKSLELAQLKKDLRQSETNCSAIEDALDEIDERVEGRDG